MLPSVTFSHDKRCNQKSPVRFSHYLCHIREPASSAHRHSVRPRRLPPCATIPAARILYPSHGSTPWADTTIHNRQPSATLECVTRCLTFSVASTTEKLPSSNGTFLDVHSTYSGLCICIECVFADILIYIYTGTREHLRITHPLIILNGVRRRQVAPLPSAR